MSITSLAEVAYVRRTDVAVSEIQAPASLTEGLNRIELVTAATPNAQTAISTALKVIVTYIPTEILTLYVAILAVMRTPDQIDSPLRLVFYSFLIVTPLVVWLVYAAKCKGGGKKLPLAPRSWPFWEMFAAAAAYTAWALAMSDNPFVLSSWYSSGLAAILLLIVSTFLGLLAPLFQRPIPS